MRGGNIAAVGPFVSTPVPEGATVIDGAGKSVMPGIVMVHEHTYYPTGPGVYGQLGMGVFVDQASVTAARTELTFATVSAANKLSCGLTTGGEAYCWGEGAEGEHGQSTLDDVPAPTRANDGRWITLSAGSHHICAVAPDGSAFCWGRDEQGQLGDTAHDRCSFQVDVYPCSAAPVRVRTTLRFTQIAAGMWHTCALTGDGIAYCWGQGGLLGDGSTQRSTTPVRVAGGLAFKALDAGASHTCGVTLANAAYCWGYNSPAVLGDGTDTNRTAPVAVAGGLSFTRVSPGGSHTCGLTTSGAAYCWGQNYFGQLGTGDTLSGSTPRPVAGGRTFVELSPSSDGACGIAEDGNMYCWGWDFFDTLAGGKAADTCQFLGTTYRCSTTPVLAIAWVLFKGGAR